MMSGAGIKSAGAGEVVPCPPFYVPLVGSRWVPLRMAVFGRSAG